MGGRELIRLLAMHPGAEVVAAAEVEGGKALGDLLPGQRKVTEAVTEEFDPHAPSRRNAMWSSLRFPAPNRWRWEQPYAARVPG